jgi:cyclohexa-1,5-dienecarbonyl-CoA hydratase
MAQFIKTAVEQGAGIVSINNPPANVLSKAVLFEIRDAVAAFQKDPGVRGIVLTGEGANFAAGADVREIATISDPAAGEKISLEAHALVRGIEESEIPVVAAINGYCMGGGCELVLACHLRIASDKARIGQPEIKIGIVPGMGGMVRLPRLVGPAAALEMLLTGEPIGAQDAHRIGLVNLVVPEADLRRQAVMFVAKRIGSMSRVAVAKILRGVRESLAMAPADAIKLEARLFGEIVATEDKAEGVKAFLEKRPPSWKDK